MSASGVTTKGSKLPIAVESVEDQSLRKSAPMTGAMFIAECLKQEGVEKVFGQCGHTNYALIDACHRMGIEYVSFRHEQMAAHAADAYFRVSHKLAVMNVHLSPGLTNALPRVAERHPNWVSVCFWLRTGWRSGRVGRRRHVGDRLLQGVEFLG